MYGHKLDLTVREIIHAFHLNFLNCRKLTKMLVCFGMSNQCGYGSDVCFYNLRHVPRFDKALDIIVDRLDLNLSNLLTRNVRILTYISSVTCHIGQIWKIVDLKEFLAMFILRLFIYFRQDDIRCNRWCYRYLEKLHINNEKQIFYHHQQTMFYSNGLKNLQTIWVILSHIVYWLHCIIHIK